MTTSFLLSACAGEQKYRGVPDSQWQQLDAKSKQLIVDKSFEDEIGS